MSKGIIVSPANRGVQVVVTDENNVQLLVDSNRGVNLEIVPQPRIEVLVDKGVEGAQGPVGPQGPQGPQGTAATVTAGTTTTGLAGTNAIVTNSGTSSAAVFDFTIPRGDTGLTGATGAGVAVGGTTGQVLVKASNVNYDTTWATITGTLVYQGSWNAATNSPTLTSSVGTNGYYYVVGTSGSTNLNGITDWVVGDWAIFNGTIWQKIDNTDLVSSVNGQTGVVVLTQPDIAGTASLTTVQTLTNKTLTSPKINEILDTNGNEILGLSPTTSATDYLTVKNGIGVGVPLHVYADGPSTNIGLHIQPKGSGLVTISDGTDFNKGIRFRSSGSAASAVTLLDAVSTAGRVVTLPDATTTLVGRDTTDTLTNKTLTSPIVNTPAITGGTINNTTIGATTPSTGVFTTLVSTGNITYFGGAVGSDVFRVYKNNTITGGTSTETSPAFSFIPKQSNFGASIVGLGENPRISTTGGDGFYFTTLASLGYSGVTQFKVQHTASAVNYVQVTGAATSSPPGITVQGSDANVRMNISSKGTESVDILTNNTGTRAAKFTYTASSVNWVQMTGAVTGSAPSYAVAGNDTNIDLNLTPKGTGQVKATNTTNMIVQSIGSSGFGSFLASSSTGSAYLFGYSGGSEVGRIYFSSANSVGIATSSAATQQFVVSHTASAVNYVQVTGGATGGSPVISAQGSDANITVITRSKGTGAHIFQNSSGNWLLRVANPTGTLVNYPMSSASVAGSPSGFQVEGSDTNIDLALTPKGTGNVRFGTYTASMALTVQGYIEIKDAGGTVRKLAVVA